MNLPTSVGFWAGIAWEVGTLAILLAALFSGCATKTVTVPAPTDEIRAQAFLDVLTALHNDASVPADCQRIAENAIVQAAPIATPAP